MPQEASIWARYVRKKVVAFCKKTFFFIPNFQSDIQHWDSTTKVEVYGTASKRTVWLPYITFPFIVRPEALVVECKFRSAVMDVEKEQVKQAAPKDGRFILALYFLPAP